MATVELRFSPLPAHVRTARLVAAAVARRCGVDEENLDEVRLAVGEACSRAVALHRRHCPDLPVLLTLTDNPTNLRVRVVDCAPVSDAEEDPLATLRQVVRGEADESLDALPSGVGLAVITGLVDDVEVEPSDTGMRVTMTWPVTARAAVARPREDR